MWYQAFTLLLGTAWLFWIKVWLFCSGLRLYLSSQNATTFSDRLFLSTLSSPPDLLFLHTLGWMSSHFVCHCHSVVDAVGHSFHLSFGTYSTYPSFTKSDEKKNSGKYIQVCSSVRFSFSFLCLLFHYTSGPFPAHSPFSTSHTTPRPSLVRLNYNPRSLRAPLWLAERKRAPTP